MTNPSEARQRAIKAILDGLRAYAPDEVEMYGRDEAEMIADYVMPWLAAEVQRAVDEEREACALVAQPKPTHVCEWSGYACQDCDRSDIAAAIRARQCAGTPHE